MSAFHQNQTWELTSLPCENHTVGCKWVYSVKYHPDGSVEYLNTRLLTKRYTLTYGVNYMETFSLVARMSSVRILISVAINRQWPMYQLNIKNAFLHGDLHEKVYMD